MTYQSDQEHEVLDLINMIRRTPDHQGRRVVRLLTELEEPAFPILIGYLEHESERVRCRVLEALVPIARGTYAWRYMLFSELRRLLEAQAGPKLIQLLKDKSTRVRRRAIKVISSLELIGAIPSLERVATEDEDWTLRKAASEALNSLRAKQPS